ncbi:MAG TPA: hypothetical protein VK762_29200 [Polyangiaceae bacterium]|nr:hypothetical protein [Polyangiaceae bacterium]
MGRRTALWSYLFALAQAVDARGAPRARDRAGGSSAAHPEDPVGDDRIDHIVDEAAREQSAEHLPARVVKLVM